MAKAKITNKGKVQVVMSPEQWEVVNSIFQHVRLGDRNEATRAFSDLVIDLDSFNTENFFGEYSEVETYVTYPGKRGNTKVLRGVDCDFCIELDIVHNGSEE